MNLHDVHDVLTWRWTDGGAPLWVIAVAVAVWVTLGVLFIRWDDRDRRRAEAEAGFDWLTEYRRRCRQTGGPTTFVSVERRVYPIGYHSRYRSRS